MLDTILDSPLSQWLRHDTEATDHIVISSRIRLARNFDGLLFTNRNDTSALEKVNAISRGLLQPLKDADGHQYSNISLEQLSQSERAVLVEKHLMSPALEEKLPYRNLVVSDDASIVIMVNEEDHYVSNLWLLDFNCNRPMTMQCKLIRLSRQSIPMLLMNALVI